MPILRTKSGVSRPTTTPSHFDKKPQVSHSPVQASPAPTDPTAVQKAKQNKAVAQPLVHPLKKFAKNPQLMKMKAYCYNCKEEVIGSKVLEHLYFGRLKCVNCWYSISWCSDFREYYPSKIKCSKEATHRLVGWEQPVKDFLFYSASRELTISKYCKNNGSLSVSEEVAHSICSYVKALSPLKDIQPWNIVLSDPLFQEQLQQSWSFQHQTQGNDKRYQNMCLFPTTDDQKLNSGSQSGDRRLLTSIPAEKSDLRPPQGTPSSSANHDNRGKLAAGVEAAKGTVEHSKETSGFVAQTTQESEHQKTTQTQRDRGNNASQQKAESLQSSVNTVHRSKEDADRKQGIVHPSIPSGSSTQIQQDRRNGASQQGAESLQSSVHTVHRSKEEADRQQAVANPSISLASETQMQQDRKNGASPQKTESLTSSTHRVHKFRAKADREQGVARPSTLLDNPTGRTRHELKSQQTHSSWPPVLSPRKSKKPQNTRVSGEESTQSISSSPKKLCRIKIEDTRAEQDMAEGAGKESTNSSRETRQKSQSINQKPSKMTKGKRKRSPKRKNWYSDFIPSKVLSSGHYLVVLYPKQDCPDECPTCYCSFYPKMCTVDLSTYVTNLVCPECHLTVYIVPKLVYDKSLEHQSELVRQV